MHEQNCPPPINSQFTAGDGNVKSLATHRANIRQVSLHWCSDDFRIAVVGFNGHGENHIEAFSKMKGARLVALCDADRIHIRLFLADPSNSLQQSMHPAAFRRSRPKRTGHSIAG